MSDPILGFYSACSIIIRRLPNHSVENVTAQGFKHRILFIFTSRSFFLSASLSAIRFLLSSSSFRASLVSVRSLSSFRILRIFLRPLCSSSSWSSSPSSPLCGNEHQGQPSDLQPSGKKKKITSYD